MPVGFYSTETFLFQYRLNMLWMLFRNCFHTIFQRHFARNCLHGTCNNSNNQTFAFEVHFAHWKTTCRCFLVWYSSAILYTHTHTHRHTRTHTHAHTRARRTRKHARARTHTTQIYWGNWKCKLWIWKYLFWARKSILRPCWLENVLSHIFKQKKWIFLIQRIRMLKLAIVDEVLAMEH